MNSVDKARLEKAKQYLHAAQAQCKTAWEAARHTLEWALDEIEEAHRRQGRKLVESLEDIQLRITRKERDSEIEKSYNQTEEE